MSSLYNLYEGSLDELAQIMQAQPSTDAFDTYGAMDGAIRSSWELVHPIIANLLDWHEQEYLLGQAHLLPGAGPDLLTRLFTDPPLGIEPFDFGFIGSLRAAELHELRRVLEATVAGQAARLEADPPSWDVPLDERDDPLDGAASVLIGIRPATPGRDVALSLG